MIQRNGYSILGYGCMRLPSDDKLAEKLIMKAYNSGINYFDTAYVYKGKEEQLGKILAKNNIREKVTVATKLPVYMIRKREQFDEFFDEELKRLQTDYVDNYLMHMLPDETTWKRLVDLGIIEWLEKKKELGQIKRVGFSFHGSTDIFLRLLDAYDWEFCMVQYNYLDENSQAGRKGVETAASKGIPVFIMEPLRGGRLTKGLNKKAQAVIAKTDKTAGEWGLSWLYNQETITCVLSGMETMEVLEENLRIVDNFKTFDEADYKVIEKIKDAINSKKHIPCTGCKYCMPCPFGVDIPGAFRCYNTSYNDGFIRGETEYVMSIAMKEEQGLVSQCKQCGKCEKVCPQQIPIRKEIKKVKRRLQPPFFRIIRRISDHYYKTGNKTIE